MSVLKRFRPVIFMFILVALFSCKKEEQVVFDNNNIPNYSEIPTIIVENYVNRMYIDLIGREPTDIEMNTDVTQLENGQLSTSARIQVLDKLIFSTEFVEGDTSYTKAFYSKVYTDTKARLLEGVSETVLWDQYYILYYSALYDSLNGNMLLYEISMLEANKVKAVLDSRDQLMNSMITVDEMYRRMMFNSIYDDINMNSFNFINASFDNLFFRYPTEAEFENAFPPIEYNGSGILFGQVVTNKSEYLQVLTTTGEYHEGLIRWAFLQLLSREATTAEIYNRMQQYAGNFTIPNIHKSIMITDEYAGFD